MSAILPSEREIQRQIIDWLNLALPYGSVVHHSANEAAPDPSRSKRATAAYFGNRRRDGVLDGFPDLILLIPPGRTVLLEVKKHNGRVQPTQDELLGRIGMAGFPVGVVRSTEDTRDVLTRAGIPLRTVRL